MGGQIEAGKSVNAAQNIEHHQGDAKNATKQGERAGRVVMHNPQLARQHLQQVTDNANQSLEELTILRQEKEADKKKLKDRKLGKDKPPAIMDVALAQHAELMPDSRDPETLKRLLATLRNMKQASQEEVLAFVEREFKEGDELNEDEQHAFLTFAQTVFESEGAPSKDIADLTTAAKKSLEAKAGPKIYKGYQTAGVAKEAEQLGWGDAKGFKREYAKAVDQAKGPGELLMLILKENTPQEAGRKLVLFGQAAQTDVAGMGHLFKSDTETASKLKAMGDLRILSQSAEKMQTLLDNTRRQAALQEVKIGEPRLMGARIQR